MTTHWYALHSKPRKEEVVWRQVRAHGFEAFYPRVPVPTANPRAGGVRPYFPGYLFVRADLSLAGLSTFQYMPYAIGLVCCGVEPAKVPDEIIRAIQRRVMDLAATGGELFDGLRSGDRVSIHAGPFAGYKAIFDARLSSGERVRLFLEMLSGRSVSLELSAAQIERINRPQTRPATA